MLKQTFDRRGKAETFNVKLNFTAQAQLKAVQSHGRTSREKGYELMLADCVGKHNGRFLLVALQLEFYDVLPDKINQLNFFMGGME